MQKNYSKKSVEDLKKELNILAAIIVAIQEQIDYLDEDSDDESTSLNDKVSLRQRK